MAGSKTKTKRNKLHLEAQINLVEEVHEATE